MLKPAVWFTATLVVSVVAYWSKSPTPLTTVKVGDRIVLPGLRGECRHIIVVHGACDLCRPARLVAPDATYLAHSRYEGDERYPNLVIDSRAYRYLGIQGIPVEIVLEHDTVTYVGSPYSEHRALPACVTGHEP